MSNLALVYFRKIGIVTISARLVNTTQNCAQNEGMTHVWQSKGCSVEHAVWCLSVARCPLLFTRRELIRSGKIYLFH